MIARIAVEVEIITGLMCLFSFPLSRKDLCPSAQDVLLKPEPPRIHVPFQLSGVEPRDTPVAKFSYPLFVRSTTS